MNKEIPIETVFRCLHKDYRGLQVEIGKEKAYNEELEMQLEDIKKAQAASEKESEALRKEVDEQRTYKEEENKAFRKEIKEQQMYQALRKQLTTYKNMLVGAKDARDKAMSEVAFIKKENERLQKENDKLVEANYLLCMANKEK